MQGRDDLGETTLREAVAVTPDIAEVHHALGLLLARVNRLDEALVELERASRLEPDVSRFSYVYAIALNAAERSPEALRVLEAARRSNPHDQDILTALVTINRDTGNRQTALAYARELSALRPNDPSITNLRRELEEVPNP